MADVGGDQLLPAPAVGAGDTDHDAGHPLIAFRIPTLTILERRLRIHHSRPSPPMERTALRPGAPGVAAIARAARSQPGDRDVEVEMDALACVLGPHDVRLIMSAGCR